MTDENRKMTTGMVLAETLIQNLDAAGMHFVPELRDSLERAAARIYDDYAACLDAAARSDGRRKTLFVIRGLPGAGKSDMAASLADAVVSEDDYFGSEGDGYQFDARRRYQGLGWMMDRAIELMDKGVPRVALATCALTLGELSPVKQAADERGYRVFACALQNSHGHRSVHGVAEGDYEWMRKNMVVTLDMSVAPETVWKNKEGK